MKGFQILRRLWSLIFTLENNQMGRFEVYSLWAVGKNERQGQCQVLMCISNNWIEGLHVCTTNTMSNETNVKWHKKSTAGVLCARSKIFFLSRFSLFHSKQYPNFPPSNPIEAIICYCWYSFCFEQSKYHFGRSSIIHGCVFSCVHSFCVNM